MLPNYKSSVEIMSKGVRDFPWDNKLAYANFLAQTYYYVCHSVRLLCASAAVFSQEDQKIHKRFLKHMNEENSHEILALRDLKNLGFSIKDFPEMAITKTMYEIQYHKIEHNDPIELMGYILALETMAGEDFPWLKKELTKLYGENCVKFVQVHADDDPDHIEKAIEVIKSLTPDRLRGIDMNMIQTGLLYNAILEACSKIAKFDDNEIKIPA